MSQRGLGKFNPSPPKWNPKCQFKTQQLSTNIWAIHSCRIDQSSPFLDACTMQAFNFRLRYDLLDATSKSMPSISFECMSEATAVKTSWVTSGHANRNSVWHGDGYPVLILTQIMAYNNNIRWASIIQSHNKDNSNSSVELAANASVSSRHSGKRGQSFEFWECEMVACIFKSQGPT